MSEATVSAVQVLSPGPTDVPGGLKDVGVWCGDIYSNLDHAFDVDVVERTRSTPLGCARHAAWDFCGTIMYEDGAWIETVMRYHQCVGKYACADLGTLIAHVNNQWGHD